jgi:hypothetical protein
MFNEITKLTPNIIAENVWQSRQAGRQTERHNMAFILFGTCRELNHSTCNLIMTYIFESHLKLLTVIESQRHLTQLNLADILGPHQYTAFFSIIARQAEKKHRLQGTIRR